MPGTELSVRDAEALDAAVGCRRQLTDPSVGPGEASRTCGAEHHGTDERAPGGHISTKKIKPTEQWGQASIFMILQLMSFLSQC